MLSLAPFCAFIILIFTYKFIVIRANTYYQKQWFNISEDSRNMIFQESFKVRNKYQCVTAFDSVHDLVFVLFDPLHKKCVGVPFCEGSLEDHHDIAYNHRVQQLAVKGESLKLSILYRIPITLRCHKCYVNFQT